MAFIANKRESIQYNGSNGTAFATWLTGATLVSDNGTTVVVSIPEQGNYPFSVGEWLIRYFTDTGDHVFAGNYTNAQYQNLFVELP